MQHQVKILIVEDHRDIAEMLYDYFEQKGYQMDYASDGRVALNLVKENKYDVILLDLMLPEVGGLEVCRKLREEINNDTPVLMLTARDTLQDKVTGLEVGADDYLVKPFEMLELDARINALIRRQKKAVRYELLEVEDLVLDTGTLQVKRAGKEIKLSPIGLKILTILLKAKTKSSNPPGVGTGNLG